MCLHHESPFERWAGSGLCKGNRGHRLAGHALWEFAKCGYDYICCVLSAALPKLGAVHCINHVQLLAFLLE